MLRQIEGFHQDATGDWVAELRCGHGQHVRHRPPFWLVPWVLTAEGRAEKVGGELPCVLCDRAELPDGFAPYKRTADFDQDSIPPALLKDHATKPGVWALIHVLAGRLHYVVEPPLAGEQVLDPEHRGVVVAEVKHRVRAEGEVRFFVEFHHRATEPSGPVEPHAS